MIPPPQTGWGGANVASVPAVDKTSRRFATGKKHVPPTDALRIIVAR